MQAVEELPEFTVGHFDFEVFGSGLNGRARSSRFRMRCDAVALHNDEILLLSVVGAESSVKALTAGLRSSGKDQQRISYSANVGPVSGIHLTRCADGYRIYRTRLGYGLWHVLCLAKRPGFMPVMTEASLWQLLQGDSFTTPLLKEWIPWLYREMQRRGAIVALNKRGCEPGLLLGDSDALDEMVSEGIQQRHLRIQGYTTADRAEVKAHHHIHNLDEYMLAYGRMLGKQAERSLHPLHVPGRDALPALDLLREPFEAQRHVIEAVRKALQRQKAVLLVGEMGTGKTLMAMAACHAHAAGSPYRGLVFCPGQLVNKWEREIRETIAGAEVMQIHSWKTLLHLDSGTKPGSAQWYVIARDRAKLGARWQPAFQVLKHGDDGFLRCPHCGRRLIDDQREPLRVGKPAHHGRPGTGLWKRRSTCEWVLANHHATTSGTNEGSSLVEGCGSPLWQMNGEIWRYEPALFIKRRLRTFFDYLILDEVHEEKGADTAQGNAAGALASCCRKVIALTGTLIGGYAEHLRPLLFRLAPDSLVREGLGWSNAMAFNERYGRIETRITSKSGGDDNRMSRGSKSTTKSVRPGIMPVLFGRHLIDKAVFVSLAEVADNLPPLQEECVAVPMDEELARAYRDKVEKPLAEAIRAMMRRQDRRLLGAMLQTLLAYPDYPFGWGPVGYWERGEGSGPGKYVTVAMPPNLSEDVLRPKEQALLELVKSEKAVRRKVWVYVQFTDKHDVQGRLQRLLQQAGFQVAVLHASTPPAKREEWIAANAPTVDVVVSHPRLVETGLDLFDKGGRHNFPTICFYETGYNLFTLRQASRRSWRIGQKERCRIVYFHYAGTMQERAMALMGKKLTAAQALEGTFTSEGLVALAGEDANVEIALARSLVERMEEGDARRHWTKVFNPRQRGEARVQTREPSTEGLPIRKARRQRIGAARAASDVGPQKLLF